MSSGFPTDVLQLLCLQLPAAAAAASVCRRPTCCFQKPLWITELRQMIAAKLHTVAFITQNRNTTKVINFKLSTYSLRVKLPRACNKSVFYSSLSALGNKLITLHNVYKVSVKCLKMIQHSWNVTLINRHVAGCDFHLPDVHLLSFYLLVKVLQEAKRKIIKMGLKRVQRFPGKTTSLYCWQRFRVSCLHCITFWTGDYFLIF